MIQVLLGLQANAIKFTPGGSVTIKTKIEHSEDDSYWLNLAVEDTGIGIEDQDKDKLFKLFGFVQDKFERNKNGIGLGLAIASQIVE